MLDSLRQYKAGIFQALANPTRVAIVELLNEGELSVGELCARLAIEQSNVSQHLAILRNKHIVQTRKQGNQIHYRLSDPVFGQVLKALRGFFLEQMSEAVDLMQEEEQAGAPVPSGAKRTRRTLKQVGRR
jgi:DNA-binding transcriptional ArsR family regulator